MKTKTQNQDYMIKGEIPLLKEELLAKCGCIGYQLIFANLDAIAVQIKKNLETVVILYRGANKVGFIYEGGTLTEERVLRIYQDVPEDKNDLGLYGQRLEYKVQLLDMPKHNYLIVNDREVVPIKPKPPKNQRL